MNFTRVTKQAPCPICKKADWCRGFADGWAECMRVQSDQPAKSGGWMHRLGAEPPRYVPPAPRWEPPAIDATKLLREWRGATTCEQLVELAMDLGLGDFGTLVDLGAVWAAPHAAWAFPRADGFGNVVGIRLRNERGKFAVRGSRQGLFLATVAPQTTLFVCEGPTDTAAALGLGLFAAGRPNCCCGGPELRIYAGRLGVARVVVVADNDKPGLDGARKVGREIKLPFAIYVPPAKDLREFVCLGGTRVMLENTLNSTIWNT